MLLPSDVARLVLGYLQEEGLSATSQAFIHESPNLKEYAEHSTGDGAIPACVFSVFGKGLTTILTEYVAIKTNETCHEVPAMMTSLWKKLDFTLKQIKAMQNSPATSACQRMRSRVGMANLARQRAVTMASTTAVVCSSVSETATIISPALTSHGMLCHSTPVSYAAPQIRSTPSSGSLSHIQDGGRLLNTPRDSPVQIIVSEHRGNPGPMSPGRRKWDTPRKRGGAASGSSGASRSTAAASSVGAEPQPEEVVDENFPQLVIQNARDKILGDRLLQEKLAENINKILANEPVPQTSKAPSSTLEADQSIDEILGLQGEIHMSDDAIHDILEQTESDPAFQALFDLFDYNKSKLPDGEPGDGDISSCTEETDTVLASTSTTTTFAPAPSDLGITVQDAAPSEPAPAKRAAPERKTRRLTAPTFIKKTNRSSRIENSSAKLLISHAEHRAVPSTATAASRRKEKSPAFSSSVAETPMDIDDFLNNAPSMSGSTAAMEAPVPVSKAPSSAGLSGSSTVPSSGAPQVDALSNMDKNKQCTQTQCSKEQAVAGPSSALVAPSVFLPPPPPPPPPPSQAEASTNLPQRPAPSSGQGAQPVLPHSKAPEPASTFATPAATVAALPLSAPTATTPAPLPSATTSSTALATLGPATPIQNIQTSPSSALVTATSECNQSPLGKPIADPSNIVSLKIIISDNQEEDSSGDAALNQAISSISMDKIPTIYLSSPAKSPGGPTLGGPTVASPGLGVPGTPRTNLDEASLAVSGLQSSEAQVNPINAAAVITSPLTGTAAGQQSYIIQLPLDTSSNPGLQAPAASYFVMAEPPATDTESRPVLMPAGVSSGQPLPTSAQFSVTTPTRPTAFAAGPTLILPSPVKPVILPVSVMGQNALGKVQMVSNQLVAIQTPVPIQQSEVVKATSPLDTVKQSTTSIAAQNLVGKLIQPVLPESTSKQKDPGPSHRRILCFDSSAKVQSPPPKAATTTAKTSPSPKSSQSGKERPQSLRTKPAILGGNKPKRRVETIRCSTEPLSGVGLVKETPAPSQKQPKDAKKSSRKQDHKVNSQDSETISTGGEEPSQPETLKSPDSGKSKSTEKTQKGSDEQRAKGSRGSGSLSSDPGPKSGSKKAEKSRKEAEDNSSSKSRAEKRTPSQEMPSVTANKENEMKSGSQEQSLPPSSSLSPSSSTSSAASSREVSPAAAAPQSGMSSPTKTPKSSKTSSLAKQAAEMLQDIHSFNSPPKAAKKASDSSTELPAPQNPPAAAAAAAQRQDPPQDCTRTPTRPRRLKDAEGTPKHGLLPPNTPEVPTCSPASETGSENSINMAAHTLMILSRAAIARTGTPLKDSLRQEGVGDKSPAGSKNPKKRKQPPASASPPAKKDAKESSGKKKERERKKFIDCFPHDLDVDKFLSSLHYDE